MSKMNYIEVGNMAQYITILWYTTKFKMYRFDKLPAKEFDVEDLSLMILMYFFFLFYKVQNFTIIHIHSGYDFIIKC